MIRSLEELVEYTISVANGYPDEVDEITLSMPGIGDVEAKEILEKYSGISLVYLNCVKKINLRGIKFGYFLLWPEDNPAASLSSSLIRANSEANPHKKRFHDNDLIEIASWESDPIVVASIDSKYVADSVLRLNTGNPNLDLERLAKNFEVFLLLVGNIDEIIMKQHNSTQKTISEFLEVCRYFKVDNESIITWEKIIKSSL